MDNKKAIEDLKTVKRFADCGFASEAIAIAITSLEREPKKVTTDDIDYWCDNYSKTPKVSDLLIAFAKYHGLLEEEEKEWIWKGNTGVVDVTTTKHHTEEEMHTLSEMGWKKDLSTERVRK